MRLRARSEITLEGEQANGRTSLDMAKGAAHFFSRSGDAQLDVKTPFTVAGVRGTEFLVESGDDEATVTVFEGLVVARNDAGSASLGSNQSAVARAGQAPAVRIVVKPRDAVQWALYYPPVLYLDDAAMPAGASWSGKLQDSRDAYLRGDAGGALTILDGVDAASVDDARFFTYRASLLLAVGSVAEAGAALDRALAISSGDSDALALRSIVALTTNDVEQALSLAQQAVGANGNSATAQLALSYAQQAQFDLEEARRSAERATVVEPANALAWARLAELHSSFGNSRKALRAAKQAVELEPGLARTQMVLGFSHLTRVEIDEAKASFERAIELDPADPLSFLGLGLAKIRSGHLKAGGRDIEVAASLGSSSSIIRSYLGKTYFEEKRTGLDEREYDVAKELDPNDPTPWFYEAISLQTTNRPVEALRSVQRAVELNDNRAVYRSSLLLDSDLAARSAAVGRIFSDLDFQQLALVEAWKSIDTDPTNFSAQRLMADSYAAMPRHEIARVSSLLQSQLLQPINIQPIQPRLADSNLFLISSLGPASASFNELNPLFNRNRVAAQANGLFGNDDTYAGEGVVSAVYDRFSVSGGYAYGETDGFRSNNDRKDQVGNVFMQAELTAATSIQAEYRYNDRKWGAQEIRFLDDHSRSLRQEEKLHTGRVGLRHSFSPSSTVLASYTYRSRDFSLYRILDSFAPDFFPDSDFDQERDEDAHIGEFQYLFRSGDLERFDALESFNAVAGGGYVDVNVDEWRKTELREDPPFPVLDPIVVAEEPDITHGNGYLYTYSHFQGDVTVTAGFSLDYFDEKGDSGVGEQDQVNGKFGLQWSPSFVPGMTLRAAAFRMQKRTLVTDQTLEPTQVAGFNQFFDDPDSTRGWRYGVAIDQRFSDRIFGGFEYSKRDLEFPLTTIAFLPTGPVTLTEFFDTDESLARVYGFWTPFDWLALRAEYRWEKFERDPLALIQFVKVKTHRVPFGAQFIHPIGLSARFGATWVKQSGDFWSDPPPFFVLTPESGERDFWILDASLRYRLPKRYGFVGVGVDNFLDEDSPYQATDVKNPSIRPGRFIYGSVTLAFP
jgi:tetratricopeptide (TPR) repeat protein